MFYCDLADQFDFIVHIDETSALHPLEKTGAWETDWRARQVGAGCCVCCVPAHRRLVCQCLPRFPLPRRTCPKLFPVGSERRRSWPHLAHADVEPAPLPILSTQEHE